MISEFINLAIWNLVGQFSIGMVEYQLSVKNLVSNICQMLNFAFRIILFQNLIRQLQELSMHGMPNGSKVNWFFAAISLYYPLYFGDFLLRDYMFTCVQWFVYID